MLLIPLRAWNSAENSYNLVSMTDFMKTFDLAKPKACQAVKFPFFSNIIWACCHMRMGGQCYDNSPLLYCSHIIMMWIRKEGGWFAGCNILRKNSCWILWYESVMTSSTGWTVTNACCIIFNCARRPSQTYETISLVTYIAKFWIPDTGVIVVFVISKQFNTIQYIANQLTHLCLLFTHHVGAIELL